MGIFNKLKIEKSMFSYYKKYEKYTASLKDKIIILNL